MSSIQYVLLIILYMIIYRLESVIDVYTNGFVHLYCLHSPNYDTVLAEQLQTYYGNINEDTVIRNILPTVQTGDLHIAFYDLTAGNMHVSFMRQAAADSSEPQYAYERQFTRLHGADLFAVPPPDLV